MGHSFEGLNFSCPVLVLVLRFNFDCLDPLPVPMKIRHPVCFSFIPVLLALALPVAAGPPTITLTTPALNLHRDLVIMGTAADTPEAAATDGRTAAAGVKEVRYQVEGSQKWRKAQLTGKNATSTGWMVPFDNHSAVGKRMLFYSVDRSGQGSAVISTRFKRSSTTPTVTTAPGTTTPAIIPGN